MTETISGQFETAEDAETALEDLLEAGIDRSDIIYDNEGLILIVIAQIGAAITVRSIIEDNGGTTEADSLADVGTLPNDPLEYSEADQPGKDWAGR